MRLLASDIDSSSFGAAAGISHIVPIGRGTLSVILQGPGVSWNTLLQNANGSVAATFGVGAISELDLPAFLKRACERGFFSLDDVSGVALPVDGVGVQAMISNGVVKIEKRGAHAHQPHLDDRYLALCRSWTGLVRSDRNRECCGHNYHNNFTRHTTHGIFL